MKKLRYTVYKMGVLHTAILISLFCTSFAAPQQPEINDQFKITDPITAPPDTVVSLDPSTQEDQPMKTKPTQLKPEAETVRIVEETTIKTVEKVNDTRSKVIVPTASFSFKIYKFISEPIIKVVNAPKVNSVLRNIGTCVVNGAMELISYYLPAPFMPLVASAAGLVIPFEPVVMLKQKMPVTSYRRAFQTALNTFLSTFDKYKIEDEYDPYMTRRFNRKFSSDNRKPDNGFD